MPGNPGQKPTKPVLAASTGVRPQPTNRVQRTATSLGPSTVAASRRSAGDRVGRTHGERVEQMRAKHAELLAEAEKAGTVRKADAPADASAAAAAATALVVPHSMRPLPDIIDTAHPDELEQEDAEPHMLTVDELEHTTPAPPVELETTQHDESELEAVDPDASLREVHAQNQEAAELELADRTLSGGELTHDEDEEHDGTGRRTEPSAPPDALDPTIDPHTEKKVVP